MEIINYFVIPLLLTLGIETIVLLILKETRGKVLAIEICLNCATNIILNLILYFLKDGSKGLYISMVIILEILVWILEGFVYYKAIKERRTAIKYTLACNMTSFLLGLLIQLL